MTKAAKTRPMATEGYSVLRMDPETGRAEVYRTGLSRARAEAFALRVTYVLSPRWYGRNVRSWLAPDLDVAVPEP